MQSAFKKAIIAICVLLGASIVFLLPGLLSNSTTELTTKSGSQSSGAAPATLPTDQPSDAADAVVPPAQIILAPTPVETPTAPTLVIPTATVLPVPTTEPAPLPTAQTAVTTAPTAVVVAPTTEPQVQATQVPVEQPTAAPTLAATAEPQVTVAEVLPEPSVEPTVEPTVEVTAEPTIGVTVEPTVEVTVEPTVGPTVESTVEVTVEATPEPTAEVAVESTVEVAAEPTIDVTVEVTAEPTVEVTAEPTVEPTTEPTGVAPAWMWVSSTDGLFLRDAPGGQIVTVMEYRDQVHISGNVIAMGDRLWAEVDIPQTGWVALAFLTEEEPSAPVVTPTNPTGPSDPPTDADWAALRNCESGGRYAVVDPSGLYHGAYQFLPQTWDGLAGQYWPELVGVLPSQASVADQDKMARQLYALQGATPWPTCGVHLR